MPFSIESAESVALQAVREAADLCIHVQTERAVQAQEKADRSPVTVADYGSQALICRRLKEAFPEIPIVAEEDAAALRDVEGDLLAIVSEEVSRVRGEEVDESTILEWVDYGGDLPEGRFWTLDPIDGTKGFLRGEHYAIALALIENGEVQFGVLCCPNLPEDRVEVAVGEGTLYAARRGEGARMGPLTSEQVDTPIEVSDETSSIEVRFTESVESGHSAHDEADDVAQQLGIVAEPVRIDSQCKYAIVARGSAEIYLRLPTRIGYLEKIWDHAAGAIVAEEAGGRVTDVDGADLDFGQGRRLEMNEGVIVTNDLMHARVLNAVIMAREV